MDNSKSSHEFERKARNGSWIYLDERADPKRHWRSSSGSTAPSSGTSPRHPLSSMKHSPMRSSSRTSSLGSSASSSTKSSPSATWPSICSPTPELSERAPEHPPRIPAKNVHATLAQREAVLGPLGLYTTRKPRRHKKSPQQCAEGFIFGKDWRHDQQ